MDLRMGQGVSVTRVREHMSLVIGHWSSVIGHWSLANSHLSLERQSGCKSAAMSAQPSKADVLEERLIDFGGPDHQFFHKISTNAAGSPHRTTDFALGDGSCTKLCRGSRG